MNDPTILVSGAGPCGDFASALLDELGVPHVADRGESAIADLAGMRAALLVANTYPRPRRLDARNAERLAEFADAGGTVYAEFATDPIGLFPEASGPARKAAFERIYVAADAPANHPVLAGFAPLTLFEEHGSRTIEVVPPESSTELLSYGLVAGVGTAVFGPAERSWPALLEIPYGSGRILYASTALTHAEAGQYRPARRWRRLVGQLLAHASAAPPEAPVELRTEPPVWAPAGQPVTLAVRGDLPQEVAGQLPPMREAGDGWRRSDPLDLTSGRYEFAAGTAATSIDVGPREHRVRDLVDKAMAWFHKAGMLFDAGDGTAGVAEGLSGDIGLDGKHPFRAQERADGVVQVAYAYRLYHQLTGEGWYRDVSDNLMRYVVERSQIIDRNSLYGAWEPRGARRDLAETNHLFADDGGWISLFAMASGHLGAGLRGAESLLRTSRDGLQTNPWRTPAVVLAAGWEQLRAAPFDRALDLSAHWNSSAHTAFCYAYATTGDRRYLDAACAGLDRMLDAYPRLRLETSRTCEMVRLVLPLTGAFRYTGERRYLDALKRVAAFLGTCVDPRTGALAEVDGRGPTSNAGYGTDEAAIFQTNDDTVTDQLYALGYAAMSFPIAAQVTELPEFDRLTEQVLDYLSRIQLASADPLLDGTWMRSFDFTEWDYFGSNCDVGWGPYCVETGWMHAPILIGAMLWLSGAEFWPPPQPAQLPLANTVREEFDVIEAGRTARLVLSRRSDGRVERSWDSPADDPPYALMGELRVAADPVWVDNPCGEAIEIYALGEDRGIYHTWIHQRSGEGRWERLGSLEFDSVPDVRYDPASASVRVVATAVDGRRYLSTLSDPRRGHLPWQEIGHTPFTGVPAYVYDPEVGTAVALPPASTTTASPDAENP